VHQVVSHCFSKLTVENKTAALCGLPETVNSSASWDEVKQKTRPKAGFNAGQIALTVV
jgi:hypothetical protein